MLYFEALGWTITALGVLQLPIWLLVAINRYPRNSWSEKFAGAFRPTRKWGPSDPQLREQYKKCLEEKFNFNFTDSAVRDAVNDDIRTLNYSLGNCCRFIKRNVNG